MINPTENAMQTNGVNPRVISTPQLQRDCQLAAKDATIAALRAELAHLSAGTWRALQSTSAARSTTTLDDPTLRFLRDRQTSGLRKELLRSGLRIRELQQTLASERRVHSEKLAIERQRHRQTRERERRLVEAERTRLNTWFLRTMERERNYYAGITAIRDRLVNNLTEIFRRPIISASLLAISSTRTTDTSITDEAVVFNEPTLELTCVRVVGESRLSCGSDVLVLISSFLISTKIPIDLAVTRGALHIVSWLFANGAQPTVRTPHVAVNSGSLAMVQTVFRYFQKTDLDATMFLDLPIQNHTAIAEWLMTEYPSQMAGEFMRLASSHTEFQQNQWAWYAERLKRQWEWEHEFDEECWQRKRARLR